MRLPPILCTALALAAFFSPAAPAEVRTWTPADPDKVPAEGEFVSADETTVTVRFGGRAIPLPLSSLSETDQTWVAEKLESDRWLDPEALGDHAALFKDDWTKAEHDGMPYQIYAPSQIEAGVTLPLVVFLHGIGDRGNDGDRHLNGLPRRFAQAANIEARPCIIVAPQCPGEQYWSGAPGDTVIDLVEELAGDLPIDGDRLYLGGYSMGGYGTWSILGKEPRLFACGFPIAGGGSPAIARSIKDIPIWNHHGDADPTVKVSESRRIVEALEDARGNIIHTELPGEGHGIAGKVLQKEELMVWIFEQNNGNGD